MKKPTTRKSTRKPVKKTPRTRARKETAARRRNSSELAAAKRKSAEFHGRPPRKIRTVAEKVDEPGTLAQLGRLVELKVSLSDRHIAEFTFSGVNLACTPDGGQLYFVGGKQELDLAALGLADDLPKDHILIGPVSEITYHTRKGFHQFEPTDYYHQFGEEKNGVMPVLAYDTRSKRLYLVGGSYQVKAEGIVN